MLFDYENRVENTSRFATPHAPYPFKSYIYIFGIQQASFNFNSLHN